MYQWRNKKILIVEDDPVTCKLIDIMLKKTGVQVFYAENGQQAIAFCTKKQALDLILMDLQLPVMDGFAATREIKTICPGVPVIVQTAYTLGGEEYKCREVGCDEYLTKPFSQGELLAMLDKYLSPHH